VTISRPLLWRTQFDAGPVGSFGNSDCSIYLPSISSPFRPFSAPEEVKAATVPATTTRLILHWLPESYASCYSCYSHSSFTLFPFFGKFRHICPLSTDLLVIRNLCSNIGEYREKVALLSFLRSPRGWVTSELKS